MIYLFTVIKKFIMGFKAKHEVIINQPKQEVMENDKSNLEVSKMDNKLNQNELEYLLNLLGEATFKGKDIQRVYNLIIKLQNQYQTWS